MASIYDQLEAEARGGARLQPTPANPVSRAVRSAVARVSDAVAASPAGAQQIENSLLDAGQFLSGLFSPGGAKSAGLVLSPRNIPKLQAALHLAMKDQAKTPENIAMAWASIKYPKLTKIPDYVRAPRGVKRPASVRGDYNPESNLARIFIDEPAPNIPLSWTSVGGRSSTTSDYVNTIMHETQHARQALRRPPTTRTDSTTGEIIMDAPSRIRAKGFNRKYNLYQEAAETEAKLKSARWLREGRDPKQVAKDVEDLKFNRYRFGNPFEVTAHKAGDTAERTFAEFSAFDTASRPGQRSRWTDTARDWIASLFGGR